jgi:hypothetical protein
MTSKPVIFAGLLATGWIALLSPALAETNTVGHSYPSGGEMTILIGNDLYAMLDSQFQRAVNPQVVALEQSDAPVIAPIAGTIANGRRQVSVSTGFIDLINHIAHAKAIDRIQPGYFREYVSDLARQADGDKPGVPANIDDPRYWKDDVMIEQAGYFNQMISITLAMNLAHDYLDHYGKYAGQMPEGKPLPINDFIALTEWDDSVKYAAQNSLNCALATEGAEALFNFIDAMPRRPAWADYIVPPGVNIQKLNRQLAQYEHEYFYGNGRETHRSIVLYKKPPRTLTTAWR